MPDTSVEPLWIVEEEPGLYKPEERFFIWFPDGKTEHFPTVEAAKTWCEERDYNYRVEFN
jgi:hypothetical protein